MLSEMWREGKNHKVGSFTAERRSKSELCQGYGEEKMGSKITDTGKALLDKRMRGYLECTNCMSKDTFIEMRNIKFSVFLCCLTGKACQIVILN